MKISKDKILDFSYKIQKDFSSTQRSVLSSLWLASPEINKYCCYKIGNSYLHYVKKMITFEGNFHDVAQSLVTSEFRKKINEECPAMPKNDQFCIA